MKLCVSPTTAEAEAEAEAEVSELELELELELDENDEEEEEESMFQPSVESSEVSCARGVARLCCAEA